MSYPADELQLVQVCDQYMESGRAKVFDADLHGALEDFRMVVALNPHCAPALRCCEALNFMLDEKPAAHDYYNRAHHNEDRAHSDTSEGVYQDVWAEFMNSIISTQPLQGSGIEVKYKEPLPPLPPSFQNTSTGFQVFSVESLFTPVIERRGNDVSVALNLKHAEFGVSNFLRTKEFQGYFVYEFEIDVSSGQAWYSSCELITVRPGAGRNTQPVQQQQISAYCLQIGTSGTTPGANVSYTYSDAISTFSLQEQMTASRAPGDKTVWEGYVESK